MRTIECSAKTVEEALSQGLEKLGVSLSDVDYEVLEEGSKGFLGLLGGKPATVRLTVREDNEVADVLSTLNGAGEAKKPAKKPEKAKQPAKSKSAAPAASEAKAKKPEAKPAEVKEAKPAVKAEAAQSCEEGSPEAKAHEFLQNVTKLMGVEVSIAVKRDEEGNIRADMQGDTLGILIGRRGETLDSLQYLTSLYVNHGRDAYVRVTLDTENYRAKREEALIRLANRMANRAIKTGRKVVMEPMNPYERRILHSALQQNAAVTTHSEGDEPNRHVVITLK